MDEVTFYRATIRAYRHTFAEILDLVDGSSSFAAQSVMEVLREAQKRLDKLAAKLPDSLADIHKALDDVATFREYDAAANRAGAHVWRALDRFYAAEDPARRGEAVPDPEKLENAALPQLLRMIEEQVDKVPADDAGDHRPDGEIA